MDVDPENKHDAPSAQSQENETATGSGGQFGDLRHERLALKSAQDPEGVDAHLQSTHDSNPSTQHEPVSPSAQDDGQSNEAETHGAAQFSIFQLSSPPTVATDQPRTTDARSSAEQQPHTAEPVPDQQASTAGVDTQQPTTQADASGLFQQATEYAPDYHQTQQHRQEDSSAADADQQPPLMEAQMAEEQDLVPDELDDTDSAIGSETQSTTTTLSQSVFDFRTEHGRTYHAYKDGKYIFPNDEREADRLDLQHHLFRITFANQLFFAPLSKPQRCLDVGTGTGIWAVEFADEFPECQVVGTDLSPGQPTLVPPNLKFVIDDAEDLWVYPDQFDFVHARLMAGCFADWPNFFRQAYQNLEPGGWLELQDYGLPVKSADGTADNTNLYRWGELLCEAARKLGRPLGSDCADYYVKWMQEAGFVDIQQRMFMWPSNGWPKDPFMKELGRWNQINILEGLEGFCLALLTRGLRWRKEEVDVFVAKVSRDFRDRKIHAYFPMPVVFGRKPLPGEVVFQG